jgi:F0F1-type ATP synthase assembly protein I
MTGKNDSYRRLSVYLGVIFLLPSTLLGGLYAGYLLDRYLDTSPWLTVLGLALGIVGAFWQLFRLLSGNERPL